MRDLSVPAASPIAPAPAARARRSRRLLSVALAAVALLATLGGLGPAPVDARDPIVTKHPASAHPPLVVGAPRVFSRGTREAKVVALTFDDGYDPKRVRQIFHTLVREHVPATFFVNGMYLSRDPGLWRSIAAAGFPIGNHTYSHRDVRTWTAHQVFGDLQRNARIVETVTGLPMARIFRPPYGLHDAASDAAAAAAGFPNIVLWDVTDGDTLRGATDAKVRAAASAGVPGSIVLLHAGPATTPRVLGDVINSYRKRGFGFVTVPVLLDLAWRAPSSAPAWNHTGVAGPIPPLPVEANPRPRPKPTTRPGSAPAAGSPAPATALPNLGQPSVSPASLPVAVSGTTGESSPTAVQPGAGSVQPGGASSSGTGGLPVIALWLVLAALGGAAVIGATRKVLDGRRPVTVQAPVLSAMPPTEPAMPPTEPAMPPTEPAMPPTEPAMPPTEPAMPPTEPAT